MKYKFDSLKLDDPDKIKLRELSEQLLKECDCITRLILFGSKARGDYTIRSDFDVLVLTSKEVTRDVRGGLYFIGDDFGSDIVVYSESKFAESECRLVQEIRKDGIEFWQN